MANGQNLQNIHQLQYQQAQGQLYQVGYFERHAVTQLNQKSLRQVTAGLVQPLYNQWRAFGYLQYDLQNTVARDGLFGLDYDACCWRIALYGRSYYNDLDDPNTNKPRRIIMAEVTLKGLAGLSGNLSSLLRQKILGYTQVETSWNSR
jgi:LPS-assembly protein